jgi:hypothetical protein
MFKLALGGLAVLAMVACGPVGSDLDETHHGAGGKADEWDWTNDPDRFNVDFDYKLADLPTEGEAKNIPWPDTYWPTYKDGTNQRWQGNDTLSPLEKYDRAFNDWTPPEGFMDLKPFKGCYSGTAEGQFDKDYYTQLGPAASYQSKYRGNAKARNGVDDDDDDEVDECSDNDGVETWWGLCHAWAPAAILESEPARAVTHNGVKFEVGDLKGLLITMYDRSSARMLGGRCNDKEVERDEHGRIKADQCRDVNAGSFHVVVANMLGKHQQAFVEDKTYNYEVWNQPVRSFKVASMEEVTARDAMTALGQESETYTYNDKAVQFFKVRTRLSYIFEPHSPTTYPLLPRIDSYTRTDTYDYILELDAGGEILGGEWIGSSKTSHPDFLWLPTRARGGNPHVSLDKVRMLVKQSLDPEPTPEPDSGPAPEPDSGPAPTPDAGPTPTGTTLVITEVMVNPDATSDTKGEWFEVHNPGTEVVDVGGWKIRDNAGTFVVPGGVSIAAGAHAVFARSGSDNGLGAVTPAVVYGNVLALGNSSDEIKIENASGEIVDRVKWSSSSAGASWQLKTPSSTNDTINTTNWCEGSQAFGAGDLGTPGAANICL